MSADIIDHFSEQFTME